jgi:hypothetical protein
MEVAYCACTYLAPGAEAALSQLFYVVHDVVSRPTYAHSSSFFYFESITVSSHPPTLFSG